MELTCFLWAHLGRSALHGCGTSVFLGTPQSIRFRRVGLIWYLQMLLGLSVFDGLGSFVFVSIDFGSVSLERSGQFGVHSATICYNLLEFGGICRNLLQFAAIC
jgi:hypothetical protein